MKLLVAFSLFLVAVQCFPQSFYPRYRPTAFRPKRQDDQISNKVNTLNDPELYPQIPGDQLGPHLNEPADVVQEVQPVQPNSELIPNSETDQNDEASDEDEDKNEENIFNLFKANSRNGGPVSFFPIVFGGYGSSGRNAGVPSGIAIANSFSTGRRGIANSNAISGNPEVFRNLRRNQEQ